MSLFDLLTPDTWTIITKISECTLWAGINGLAWAALKPLNGVT